MKLVLPKIGLALGSGGVKGLAHIGVIKVLEKNNIPIDFIAGSSIGAIIGGLYSLTKDIDWIEKTMLDTNWKRAFSLLVEPALFSGGLVRGEKIEKFLLGLVGDKKFRDLKIPFRAMATDINTGEEIELKKGSLIKAIRASASVPLIFKPIKLNDRLLVDGGLSNPVPDDIVKKMGAEIIIAVNLDAYFFQKGNKERTKIRKLGLYAIINNTINILRSHLAEYSLLDADIVISPKTKEKSWTKFIDGKKIIQSGETETELVMPKIKKYLNIPANN